MLKVILSLFAASLLISQTAMDVFASIIFLAMAWMAYRWREQRSNRSVWNSMGFDWIFLIWIGVVFAGFAAGDMGNDHWWRALIEFKWLIVFYALLALVIYLQPNEKVLPLVAIIFSICSLYAIGVWIVGLDPIHPGQALETLPDGTLRTGGFLSQPIVFAHLYQLPVCLLVGMWFSMWQWRDSRQWWILLSALLGMIAILLSFSRGVWISLSLALVVMAIMFSLRMAFVLIGAGGLLFFGLFSFWPNFQERIRYAMQGGDTERIYIWKANLQMFKDHPILGLGYQENIEALHEYYKTVGAPKDFMITHAHNQYLHMLSGTGALGLLVYVLILGYFLVLSIRVWKKIGSRDFFHKGLALGLVGAQVAFILGGLTEANLEHSKMKYCLALVWALTVWLAYEYRVLRTKI